jgi:dolichyl-diphosphooligosaccharide--protein glycosyltransferase
MLTLTPVVCVASALAVTQLLQTYINPYTPAPDTSSPGDGESIVETLLSTNSAPTSSTETTSTPISKKAKKVASQVSESASSSSTISSTPSFSPDNSSSTPTWRQGIFGLGPRLIVVGNMTLLLLLFVLHCTWVTSNAYSSPSVVLSTRNNDGSQNIIDDFREAYYWLRMNTKEDAVVMSWWDYGYQIAGMADRPTLVDNNTWNNSPLTTFLPFPFLDRSAETDLVPLLQLTLEPSERPCLRPRRFLIPSLRNMTSTTFSSSLEAFSATLGSSFPFFFFDAGSLFCLAADCTLAPSRL